MKRRKIAALQYRAALDPDRILGFRACPPFLPEDVLRWPGESLGSFMERVRAITRPHDGREVELEIIVSGRTQ